MIWYDHKGNVISLERMLEEQYPLEVPTPEEALEDYLHAKALLDEGVCGPTTCVWARKLVRAYLYAECLHPGAISPEEG